jgi:[protein-PII] uridylyltransferase
VTDSTGQWRAIQEQFLATGDTAAVGKALTELRDETVVEAYGTVLKPALPRGVAMLAAGGYGRGQAFPYSEIDIVLLADSDSQAEALKLKLPEFVRRLWNAGLRLNPAVHTIEECVESVGRASVEAFGLMDRRMLDGDRAVYGQLDARLTAAQTLHREKLRQRLCQIARARHSAYGNTPCHAEPDVKDGPGGLEDERFLHLLARLGAESRDLREPVAFIAGARYFLHYRTGSDSNVLDFEAQANFGGRAYFRHARTIFHAARHAVDEAEKTESSLLENFREYRSRLSNQEFTVVRERLLLRNPGQLASDPELVFRLLEFVARHGVAESAETERRLASVAMLRPRWANLKPILALPHASLALRTMEAAGLLRAWLPEWEAVEGLVHANAGYRYTADEFTLRTVEAIAELASATAPERRRFAELVAEIDDPALLVFTLLFQEMGADAARAVAVRMEMPAETREALEFLLAHQSDLSGTIAARDLDDPATVRLLADRVGTIERLRLLAAIGYAGLVAAGTSDNLAWRLDQLWRAYSLTQHELLRELETDRIQKVPEDLPANAGFVKGFPLRYLRAHTAAEIQEHVELYERSRPTGVAVKLEGLEGAYCITIVARDKPALFASFAGAISSFGLDILKAEAFSNSSGAILDTFVVADPRRMLQLNPSETDRLRDLLQRIALGKTDAQKLMRGRGPKEAGKRSEPRVEFDSDACPSATLVEIDAEDRPGLLYSLATVFSSSACNIDVVLVDTKGRRAIDVFYVAHEGRKLSPEMQQRLKEKLLAAC